MDQKSLHVISKNSKKYGKYDVSQRKSSKHDIKTARSGKSW